jgi:hypothetical protein
MNIRQNVKWSCRGVFKQDKSTKRPERPQFVIQQSKFATTLTACAMYRVSTRKHGCIMQVTTCIAGFWISEKENISVSRRSDTVGGYEHDEERKRKSESNRLGAVLAMRTSPRPCVWRSHFTQSHTSNASGSVKYAFAMQAVPPLLVPIVFNVTRISISPANAVPFCSAGKTQLPDEGRGPLLLRYRALWYGIRKSVVGTATWLRAGRSEVRIPVRTKGALGLTQPFIQWVARCFPVGKTAEAWG